MDNKGKLVCEITGGKSIKYIGIYSHEDERYYYTNGVYNQSVEKSKAVFFTDKSEFLDYKGK